jgi:CD80-like C2-set immunoglobulin domain
VSEKARNNNLEVNEEFIAECVARGGRPAANISFYLDDEPIEQHGQQQEVHEKIGRDNTTTFEASHTISWNLRATDNGRMLICRAFHFAYPNNHSDVSTQIVVNCKLTNQRNQYELKIKIRVC